MSEFVKEFLQFLKERKKLWLIPLLVLFISLAAILTLTEGTAVAPLLYSIF